MADTTLEQQQHASNTAAVKSQAEAVKRNQEEAAAHRADQAKLNEETMARQAKYRPTPTVEEVQRALGGENVDDKEPDGSPEQNVHHRTTPVSRQIEVGRKTSEAKPSGVDKSGYQTRASEQQKK